MASFFAVIVAAAVAALVWFSLRPRAAPPPAVPLPPRPSPAEGLPAVAAATTAAAAPSAQAAAVGGSAALVTGITVMAGDLRAQAEAVAGMIGATATEKEPPK